ncbi:MAG: ATP phosphoribosyltransferase regulatory subunit, partial [Candidatus Subteraquimicrobiales bacterium]|nr:ATP phosphoribosyltransferase regulatory subunit [Candidatus Subteraquimicrobiales bacterium]
GLLNLGLKKFKVGVGQIEIIRGLIESFSLSLKSQEEIKLAISQKDLVSLEKLVEESDLPLKPKRLLVEVSSLRGEEEILQAVSPYLKDEKSKNALNNLERVYKLLKSYGLGEFVSPDLGVVRSFDYYTGVVFEVCAEGLGFPIGGGGRYDRLLSEFGWNMPAAGFALGIERTHIALTEQKVFKPEVKKRAIVFSTKGADFLFEVAKALRQQNITIETSLDLLTSEESINLAKKQQVNWVVNVDNFPDNLEVVEVRSGKSQICQSDALGKMLR